MNPKLQKIELLVRQGYSRTQAQWKIQEDRIAELEVELQLAQKREVALWKALEPFLRATNFYSGDTNNDYSLTVKGADIRNARLVEQTYARAT